MSARLRFISVSTVLVIVIATVLAGRAWWNGRGSVELSADFTSAVGLYPGSDVQVLGVTVGKVTSVEPRGPVVRVGMALEPDQDVAADTKAVIVAPTLVSDRYVQLTKPDTGSKTLATGTVLEASRTAVPVEIDELYQSLTDIGTDLGPEGANRDGALSDLLDVAAANLKGQGTDLNRMIRNFGKASATLSGVDEDLFATIGNLADFNDMLVTNDRAVATVNRQFASVTDYLADDRQDMAAAIANLGDALAILDDFIADNRGHLKTSVKNLIGPTQTLVNQKASLEESVRLIPLVLQNFLHAYDPGRNTLDGRGNLNETTIWSSSGLSRRTSKSAPPVLIPGTEGAP